MQILRLPWFGQGVTMHGKQGRCRHNTKFLLSTGGPQDEKASPENSS
jgi:hypothetical protein